MSVNPYTADKALAHLDRLRPFYTKGVPKPVHAHFIVSDLCNQHCNFCAYRAQGYTDIFLEDGKLPKRLMNYQKALEILNDLADLGVKAIQFTGGGEPTMHPKLVDLMLVALSRGMEISLVTNGSRLNDAINDVLMQATWIRVSIDCGSAKTYASMRNSTEDMFDKVWGNLRAVVRARDINKSKLLIGVGYVITKDNWQELPQGVALAKDTGVDNIRISAVFQSEDATYFDGFAQEASDLCRKMEEESTDTFRVVNNFDDRLNDLVQKSPKNPLCHHQFLVPYIGADLNLYRCCQLSYRYQGLVGSIADRRLKDFWGSKDWWLKMYGYDARTCPRCQFNDKNERMNELVKSFAIPHVNHL